MSSPDPRNRSEFDLTIGRELQSWAGRQQAPAEIRRRVLTGAGALARNRSRRAGAQLSFQRLRQMLHLAPAPRRPKLPTSELSQWLFNQAMWHSLGNDRRAVRFVC